MKKLLFLMLLVITTIQGYSQTEGITYQAVILSPEAQEIPGANVPGNILASTQIGIQFTIIDNASNEEYKEQHITSTDKYGMINLLIGGGSSTSTNNFSDIIWDGSPKLLKVEIDFSANGNNFIPLSEQNLTYMPQPGSSETLHRINDNAASIIAEQIRAEAEEVTLQSNIDALQVNTDAAMTNVQADVDANETASDAADVTLQNNINTVQADVDANETTTNTAIANVQADVDANETANDATDATLQNNINTVQADVDANETAANTAIANVQADIDANEVATNNALGLKADLDSPIFTGVPTAPTAIAGTNTTQIATTEFVTSLTVDYLPLIGGTLTGALTGTTGTFSSILEASSLSLRSATKDWRFGLSGADLVLHQGGCCNRLTIDESGRFGIGANYTPSYQLDVQGDGRFTNSVIGNSFVKAGGTSSQFLKADGSVDSNVYITSAAANSNFVDLTTNQTIAGNKTFTGMISGITKAMVGLGNVDNTTDANKPVSTATQTALDLKVDKETGKGLSTEDYSTAEKTKLAAISGTNTGDQDLSSYATNANLALKANIASPTFTGTVSGITSTMVGLGNVDNTSDVNKPVSTATQTALDLKVDKETGKGLSTEDYSTAEKTKLAAISGTNTGDQDLSSYATNANLALKANIASPTFTGTVSGITSTMVGLGNVDNTTDANKPVSTATQTALDLKVDKETGKGLSTEDYSTAEKTKLAAISGTNTGDQDLSSYATNANLALKANIASPTFTGTVSGITSTMVGLGNVDNTTDANKPVSTATQTALDLKANLVSPTFTGIPTVPTATAGTNTTQVATTAFVTSALSGGGFVDLTSNQTIAGIKTFSSNIVAQGVIVGAGVNGVASNTAIGTNVLVSNSSGVNNVAIGTQAGFSITGSNNVAIGTATNRNAAEGDGNIAIGNGANYQGTSGADNIALGTLAYRQGNSGSNNIVLGRAALYEESTGSNNIALGNEASRNNNGGEGNITLGYRAGNTITTGDYNLIIGYDADVSSGALTNATAIGNGAVVSANNTLQLGNGSVTDIITSGKLTTGAITLPNTDGTANQVLQTNGSGVLTWTTPSTIATSYSGILPVANGGTGSATQNFVDLTTNQSISGTKTFSSNASFNGTIIGVGNASGSSNTAVGGNALNGVSTGHRNTAIGQSSMLNYVGTSFDNNTSVGYSNLVGLTTGSGNTSVGAESMMALQTGTSNTSIGNQSLISTTGNNNVGVGQRSGDVLTTGSNNTIIGTTANVLANNQTNSTALGYGAVVTANNTIQLGNTSVTAVNTSASITATSYIKSGGTASQFLMADGSVSTGAAPVREVADEFSATASQTSFTLTQTPSANSKVKMYINGIRISNTAYSVSGTTLTYVPANNGAYALSVSDRIQFDFYY